MPAGKAVGLYIHADGVMVLGTGRIAAAGGEEQTPAYNKLQTGDYIYAVNGRKVVTIRDVSRLVQKNGAKQMILSVKRDSGRIQVKLTPAGRRMEATRSACGSERTPRGSGRSPL